MSQDNDDPPSRPDSAFDGALRSLGGLCEHQTAIEAAAASAAGLVQPHTTALQSALASLASLSQNRTAVEAAAASPAGLVQPHTTALQSALASLASLYQNRTAIEDAAISVAGALRSHPTTLRSALASMAGLYERESAVAAAAASTVSWAQSHQAAFQSAVTKLHSAQFGGLVAELTDPNRSVSGPVTQALEEVRNALNDGLRSTATSSAHEATAADPEWAPDEFTAALDAFIAVGLAGKDFLVNSMTLAWLLTLRQVDRAWGRKAARQALAGFIAAAATLVLTAWLVGDADKATSEALVMAAPLPLGILVAIWSKVGGK
jgi:hypothetical protein